MKLIKQCLHCQEFVEEYLDVENEPGPASLLIDRFHKPQVHHCKLGPDEALGLGVLLAIGLEND